jgi:hypothetical protein
MTGRLDPDLQAAQRREVSVSFDLSKISTEQIRLIFGQPAMTVHCLFACPHILRHFNPQGAHDEMERHYEDAHADQIAVLVAGLVPPQRSSVVNADRARNASTPRSKP